ncbi:SMC-Scp complex subunit ScpB [Acetobacter pasteurianus]|uniref:Chromosome segregation and condensation protein ScpB n=2 Tax=Acetobacter pasteurianus TaxID=438 RepID=C7JE46_ACEP3|nr:SMC-Scp complex subunit ScpB [Acetobacter pasteurianus]ASC06226.1 Segregation and condensation protein B like protein [Acetobacter pasteurianus subsp. pasteurianus]BAI00230.1 chromosome segregation and condensation protein ScpB [Acetobacter pasteurianus IFO 3283-01]BAI03283.1 chromosome segregation and condensation protein ScpB [Acetobacter pasteurianus IFO 3283-03]BAI06328.1 chromosome segregation and condensation protein ScpB [Acetobacter pasteurianus IFO 3283-07]BAI09378.1 chromosome seg
MTTDIADNAASESAEAIKVVQPENTMVSEEALRLAEALIFASTEPVSARRLAELLELRQLVPDGVDNLAAFVTSVLQALVQRYEGRGVMPVEIAGGWQFRTAPDLAPALTRVLERPRRFSRAVMETLAIIAYHQPCTRVQIEEIRGVSLGQNVLDTLIESALIMPKGRKEVPGRPVLWGTTQDFLRHFSLRSLADLPRREELLVEVPENAGAMGRPQTEITFVNGAEEVADQAEHTSDISGMDAQLESALQTDAGLASAAENTDMQAEKTPEVAEESRKPHVSASEGS